MTGQRLTRASATGLAIALSAALASGCGVSVTQPTTARSEREHAKTTSTAGSTATTVATRRSPPARAAPSKQAHQRAHRAIPPAHPVPAAFEPAPGAASDAEVRSELAQMAAVEREQREQSLSAAAANLEDLLPWTSEPKSGTQISVASVFTDYGLGLACGGVLGRDQLGVAHKTAPCGTLITFTYGGRSLTVPVIDRGPYIAGREWDLTGATAAALGFPGLGKIEWSLARS
ncbi:MAG TPA: septal ring lytic transglycosylase RlpA family protein [Solirubrobacteraceae bacterium]|nr:septal ring lytic transglycosylase RlpA family protein [Solirubrobacteraceae bacterium]